MLSDKEKCEMRRKGFGRTFDAVELSQQARRMCHVTRVDPNYLPIDTGNLVRNLAHYSYFIISLVSFSVLR